MKLSKEFRIGLIAVVALALLYWGFNFLKGEDIFSNDRVFYAVYKDIAGLQKSNPVSVNGLVVGQVRNIHLTDDGKYNVVVEMLISDDLDIPVNSTAKISNSDLLGSKSVEILIGNAGEMAHSGDTLSAEVEISIKEEVNRQIAPLKNKAEDLMASIDTVLTMLQSLFSDANTGNFSKSVLHIANSFENLEHTTGTLDTLITDQRSRMEQILVHVESIAHNLDENEEEFNNIISNFSAISDSLAGVEFAQTMHHLNTTLRNLDSITTDINKGTGSMGQLIQNDSLYFELERSSRELKLLLEDIRLHPERYVRFSIF
ncbi:MAG: MlaD family protein [Bacteroidales bacterium]